MQGSLDVDAPHTADVVRAVMARYAAALKLNDKLFQVLDTKTFHAHGSKLVHFVVAMCACLPFVAAAHVLSPTARQMWLLREPC